MRHRLERRAPGVSVVIVADQVGASLDLGSVRPEQRRIGRLGAMGEGRVEGRRRPRTAEVRVREVRARVDDGDLDALAVERRRAAPHRGRADERDADRVDRLVGEDGLDAHDARQPRHRGELRRRGAHLDAVDGVLHLGEHGAAHRLDAGSYRVLLLAQAIGDRASLGLGDLLPGRAAADHRDRITGHLQNHGERLGPQDRVAERLLVGQDLLEPLRRVSLGKGNRGKRCGHNRSSQ